MQGDGYTPMKDILKGALCLAQQITGNREDSRDILQSAMVKTLEQRGAPRPDEAGFKPWLYRVVRNQSIDLLRARRKFVDAPDLPEPVSAAQEPGHLLGLEESKRQLHQALGRLTPEQREIVCLKDFHDFSYTDIANILAIDKGNVMVRLHRARQALKRELLALGATVGGHDEL